MGVVTDVHIRRLFRLVRHRRGYTEPVGKRQAAERHHRHVLAVRGRARQAADRRHGNGFVSQRSRAAGVLGRHVAAVDTRENERTLN
jgi:hypothetical protein